MPTLSEIRDELKFYSGRYDLSDARLTTLINKGQDMLDQMMVLPQRRNHVTITPSAGTYAYNISRLLKLHWIQLMDSSGLILETPTRLNPQEFFELFPNYQNASNGLPSHWALWVEDEDNTLDRAVLLVNPAFNGVYQLTYFADLKQPVLTADDDSNVWSNVYDDLLLDAAQMMIEKRYRNTEGVRDFIQVVRARTTGIDRQSALHEDPGWEALRG